MAGLSLLISFRDWWCDNFLEEESDSVRRQFRSSRGPRPRDSDRPVPLATVVAKGGMLVRIRLSRITTLTRKPFKPVNHYATVSLLCKDGNPRAVTPVLNRVPGVHLPRQPGVVECAIKPDSGDSAVANFQLPTDGDFSSHVLALPQLRTSSPGIVS
jgi:hypothetical protein